MTETILNIAFKALDVLLWIAAFFVLIKSRITTKTAKKVLDKEYTEALKNKGEQLAHEEELKPMAKFLCDKCGKETKVKDSQTFTPEGASTSLDLCPECYEFMTARAKAYEEAQAEYNAAVVALERARLKLLELSKQDGESSENGDPSLSDAVLEKLGLKG